MLFEILDKLFFVVIETDFPDLLFQLSSSTFSQLCMKLATFSATLINVEYNLEIICLHQHWQRTIAQILRVKASIIRPDFLSNQMHTHAYTHTHAHTPHVFVNRAQNSCNLPEINWILDHLHFYIVYQQKMEIASLLMWKKRDKEREGGKVNVLVEPLIQILIHTVPIHLIILQQILQGGNWYAGLNCRQLLRTPTDA